MIFIFVKRWLFKLNYKCLMVFLFSYHTMPGLGEKGVAVIICKNNHVHLVRLILYIITYQSQKICFVQIKHIGI